MRIGTIVMIGLLLAGGCRAKEQPPVADAGKDQTIHLGEEAEGDPSVSHDPDGSIVKACFKWAYDSAGHVTEKCLSGPDAATIHQSIYGIKEPGKYTVTLTVTDDKGLSSSDTFVVTVLPKP